MNFNQVDRETINKRIKVLLPYVQAWEIKAGALTIGEGDGGEDSGEFDKVIDKLEETFNGQIVTIRMGNKDSRGKLAANVQKFQFIYSDGTQPADESVIQLMPQQQNNPFQVQLGGLPGKASSISMEQLDGLVDARVKRIGDNIKAELQAEYMLKMAKLEADQIIRDAKVEKERLISEANRELEKLKEQQERLVEKEAEFDEKQEGDYRTIKGIFNGVVNSALDFGKDFFDKDKGLISGLDNDPEEAEPDTDPVEFEEVIETDKPDDTEVTDKSSIENKDN